MREATFHAPEERLVDWRSITRPAPAMSTLRIDSGGATEKGIAGFPFVFEFLGRSDEPILMFVHEPLVSSELGVCVCVCTRLLIFIDVYIPRLVSGYIYR